MLRKVCLCPLLSVFSMETMAPHKKSPTLGIKSSNHFVGLHLPLDCNFTNSIELAVGHVHLYTRWLLWNVLFCARKKSRCTFRWCCVELLWTLLNLFINRKETSSWDNFLLPSLSVSLLPNLKAAVFYRKQMWTEWDFFLKLLHK